MNVLIPWLKDLYVSLSRFMRETDAGVLSELLVFLCVYNYCKPLDFIAGMKAQKG